jgi:hypothetical protein
MKKFIYPITTFIFFFLMVLVAYSPAEEQKDMGGWERSGRYDKLYVPSDRDSIKGIVVGFKEIIPFPGMSPGVALLIKDSSGDVVTVHLGPRWFINPSTIGIRKDDKVKVKGIWTELNNEDVVIASKISKGDFFEYKIRLTKDGRPFWTLNKEELEKERAESLKQEKKE